MIEKSENSFDNQITVGDNLDGGSAVLLKRSERNSNFELLRIISMIMIVAFHASRYIDISQLTIINRIMRYMISSWGILGVDLFVILSAWFISDQKFRMAKILSLVFEIFTWVFAFLLISITWNTYKTGDFIFSLNYVLEYHANAFFSPFWANEYWFVTSYIFMLLLAPFFNKMHDMLGQKSMKILLIILSFIPIYSNFSGEGIIKDVANFCYIFLLVSYLKRTGFCLTKKWQKILPYFFIFLIIAGKSLFNLLTDNISSISDDSIKNIFFFTQNFFNKTFLNCTRHSTVLLIISLLLFFSLKDIRPFYSKTVNLISSCTLGVYLFHENSLFNLCDAFITKAIQLGFIQYDALFPITYLAVILFIFVLGTILEFLRFQILQKPFNQIIRKYKFKKIDNFINFNNNTNKDSQQYV